MASTAGKNIKVTFDVGANIESFKSSIGQIQNSLRGLNIPSSLGKGLEGTFTKLTNEITHLQSLSSKGFLSSANDVNKVNKSYEKIADLVGTLNVQLNQVKGLDPKKLIPEANLNKLKELNSSWEKLKETIAKTGDNSAALKKQTDAVEKQRQKVADLIAEQQKYANLKANSETNKDALTQNLTNATERAKELQKALEEIENSGSVKNNTRYTQLKKELEEVNKDISSYNSQIRAAEKDESNFNQKIIEVSGNLDKEQQKLDGTVVKLEELQAIANQAPQGLDELRQKLADIRGIDISQIPTDIKELETEINSINGENVNKVKEALEKLVSPAKEASKAVEGIGEASQRASEQTRELTSHQQELEQFANRIKYFFSIGNTVMLFRRAINSAIDTVKDLDAVMTQAAVVTKYSVADMWAQLPEYSKRASELGVTIKGVYEASTLYYQQGLETNQVIGVANETLKMAKIAGLDYATATDYMTSALRGFNMEVNEASAQKVNDIYSQLAAHTASNVEEISTAMSKTAPLAHNAGMEIETTAALLAQMIERTREAPETLGTAMKTVIARFQELKKDPALIEPVDGEIVDANKVEAALRTIGVSLRDTSGQFRELDDVFLEISEKWDSLDTNTQRYIATIAAGSRQQSRFIAMMADYKRTTDLVALANNAAGASAEQFAKTQESLESKINRLKTAWQQFLMGLANNQAIKTGVDLLTKFIDTINKLTDKLSGKSGGLKTLLDFGILIGGIKIARSALTSFFAWFTKSSGTTARVIKDSLGNVIATSDISKSQKSWSGFFKSFKPGLASVSVQAKITRQDLLKMIPPNAQYKQNLRDMQGLSQQMKVLRADGKANSAEYQALSNTYMKLNAQVMAYREELVKQGSAANVATIGNENLTESEKRYLLTAIQTGAISEEQIVLMGAKTSAKYAEAIATGKLFKAELLEANAKATNNALEKGGIAGILTTIGLLVTKNATMQGEVTITWADVKAKIAAAIAQGTLNTSMLVGLGIILAVVAAVGLLVFGIVKLVQHLKSLTLEERMKAAAEETKRAKEAADAAGKAYEDLLSDKSSYDELQQTLKDLTYGTQEWKQALVEANQQVLELLQKYPQLMQYLEKGEYGQLTINAEGWENVVNAQQQAVTRAQGAVAQSQIQQYNLQKQKLGADLNKNFEYTEYSQGGPYTAIDTTTKNALRDLIDEGFTGDFAEKLQEMGVQSQLTADQINDAAVAMMEYDQAVQQNALEMKNAAQAFLTTALDSDVSARLSQTQGAAENIVNAFSDNLVKTSEQEISKIAGDIKSNQGMRDNIAKELGVVLGGNTKNQMQQIYAALTNQTLQEVKDMKLSKDQLAKEIAKYQNSEDITEAMNDFAGSFLELPEQLRKVLNTAMSEGADFIAGDEDFDIDAYIAGLDETEQKAIEAVYGTLDDFKVAYEEAVTNGQIEIEEARASLRGILNDPDLFGDSLDAGAISGLAQHLQEVFDVSGRDAAQTMADNIQDVLSKLDTKEAEDFVSALNGIDWKNADSVDLLSERIKDLKPVLSAAGINVDDLEEQIKDLAKAAKTVDLEKVAEQIKKLSKIQYELQNTDKGNNFSEDEYKSLIDAGVASAGDFVYNLATDSWNYVSGSMDSLSTAINANTDALLGLSDIESGIRSSEVADVIKEQYKNIDQSNNEEVLGAINAYIEKAGEDSIVSQDKINLLQEQLEDGYYTEEEYQQEMVGIWKDILGEAYELENRKSEKDRVEQEGKSITAQNNTTQQNADLAIQNGVLSGDNPYTKALIAQAEAAKVDEEQINKLTSAIENNQLYTAQNAAEQLASITSTYQQAAAFGVDSEQVKALAEQLINEGIVSKENTDIAYALALANINLNTGLQTLSDNYDEYIGKLKEGLASEDAAARATSEYINALSNTKKAVQQVLNTQADLSDSFIEAAVSSGLLDKALAGSREALQELYALAGKEFIIDLKLNLDEDSLDEINTTIDNLTAEDVEIGATLDTTSFGEALVDLLVAAGATVDDINSAFEQIGWEPDFDYEEMTLDQAQDYGLQGTQQIIVPDGKDAQGNVKYRVDTLESYSAGNAAGDTLIRVPVIRSKGGGTIGNGGAVATSLSKAMGAKTTFSGSSAPKVRPTKNYTPSSSGGGGGSGGGSEKEEEPWENPYDWLYNLTQKINAELRVREKLERRYQRLLKSYKATGTELKKITDEEIASLKKRQQYEEEMIKLRKEELKAYLAANAALAKYATIDWELEVVQIDYNAINAVTDKEEGEKIEKYIEKLEKILDEIKSAEDALEDIEDDLIDLEQRGRDQYRDLEDRVLDALISEQQDIIDEQERIYDAINDAASKLINAISKNIEKIRQDRQNEETELSIAEKERRLAYLRQDTTGSNALEIQRLEKELDKEKENYTDTLIDQALNDLKEQNDKAAEQRDKQIELLQSQLDWQEKTGYWVDEATRIVREGIGENGVIDKSSRMYQLLSVQEGLPSMSNASRDQWNDDLANTVAEAFVWLQNLLKNNGETSTTTGDRDIMAQMIAQSNKGKEENKGMEVLGQLEKERNAKIDANGLSDQYNKTYMVENYKSGYNSYNSAKDKDTDWMKEINNAINNSDWQNAFFYAGKRDAKIDSENVDDKYKSDWTFDMVFDKWYQATGSKTFKRGGLADFTGPAWLDGTKSKPEAVLNARDTENFLQLRDVLSGLRSNLVGANKGSGDWYFDIDINVDEIANDYDVDKVAERIKQSIYEETAYRNVNAINFLK